MTQQDQIKILNFLLILQIAIYHADEVSNIPNFKRNATKSVLNRLDEVIKKEHGEAIKGLWNDTRIKTEQTVAEGERFRQNIVKIPYYAYKELNDVIEEFIKKNNIV